MLSFNGNVTDTTTGSHSVEIRRNGVVVPGGLTNITSFSNEVHEMTVNCVSELLSGDTITIYITLSTTAGSIINPGFHIVKASGLRGPKGDIGQSGADGADGDITWQGQWVSTTPYVTNQAVYNNGTSYVCILANSNQEPPNATYWDILSLKGDDGAPAEIIDIQIEDTTGGQDINQVAETTINFDTSFNTEPSYFSITAGVVTVYSAGTYEVSYQVNVDGTANARGVPYTAVQQNATNLLKTLATCYTRNTTNDKGTNSLSAVKITVAANDTLKIVGYASGEINPDVTIANASWFRIKLIELT